MELTFGGTKFVTFLSQKRNKIVTTLVYIPTSVQLPLCSRLREQPIFVNKTKNHLMKKLILLLVLALTACDTPFQNAPAKQESEVVIGGEYRGNIYVVEVDGCEYILWSSYQMGGGIVHKQNCKNH
jgi:hypothetical protein